jgi:hypothetical protein
MKHVDLMRLHDGELTEEEALELEAALAAEDRAVLNGLSDLGDRIRLMNEHPSVDLTDDIMARLDEAPALQAAPVVELRPRRTGVYVAAALGLAAAAAVVLWFANAKSPETPTARPTATPITTPSPTPEIMPLQEEAVADLALPEDEGAAIESVDFGNRNGTIFMVPAGEETTPVVWLADESDARMEPL